MTSGDVDTALDLMSRKDTKSKRDGVQALVGYLEHTGEITLEQVDNAATSLSPLLTDNNPHICRGACQLIQLLIKQCGQAVRDHFSLWNPGLISVLGHSRPEMRAEALACVMAMMSVQSVAAVFNRFKNELRVNKNPNVRASVVKLVVEILRVHGERGLHINAPLITWLVRALCDSSPDVRVAAEEALCEVYRYTGPQLVSVLSDKHSVRPSQMRSLQERFSSVDVNRGTPLVTLDDNGIGVQPKAAFKLSDGMGSPTMRSTGSGSVDSAMPSSPAVSGVGSSPAAARGVRPVILSSEKELESTLEPVLDLLNQNVDWSKRTQALEQLQGIVIGGAHTQHDNFISLLLPVRQGLANQCGDLRSSVVKEVFVRIKVISTAANECVRALIQNVRAPKVIPMFAEPMKGRNGTLIDRCCEYIALLLECWPKQLLERYTDVLEAALKRGLSAPGTDARNAVRLAYRSYATAWPSRSSAFYASLSPSDRKRLDASATGGSTAAAKRRPVRPRPQRPATSTGAARRASTAVGAGSSGSAVSAALASTAPASLSSAGSGGATGSTRLAATAPLQRVRPHTAGSTAGASAGPKKVAAGPKRIGHAQRVNQAAATPAAGSASSSPRVVRTQSATPPPAMQQQQLGSANGATAAAQSRVPVRHQTASSSPATPGAVAAQATPTRTAASTALPPSSAHRTPLRYASTPTTAPPTRVSPAPQVNQTPSSGVTSAEPNATPARRIASTATATTTSGLTAGSPAVAADTPASARRLAQATVATPASAVSSATQSGVSPASVWVSADRALADLTAPSPVTFRGREISTPQSSRYAGTGSAAGTPVTVRGNGVDTRSTPRAYDATAYSPAVTVNTWVGRGSASSTVSSPEASASLPSLSSLVDTLSLGSPAERREALHLLAKHSRRNNAAAWNQHFGQVFLAVRSRLSDADAAMRELAVLVLREMLRNQSSRFAEFNTTVLVELLTCCEDESREVLHAAEDALDEAMQHLPPLKCLDVIKQAIVSEDGVKLQAAIRLLAKLAARLPTDTLLAQLPDVVPSLLVAFKNPHADVRKSVVFCLVDLYIMLGEQFSPYFEHLTTSQLKLVQIYIGRARKARNEQLSRGL